VPYTQGGGTGGRGGAGSELQGEVGEETDDDDSRDSGGGGGAAGRIRINVRDPDALILRGVISPDPSTKAMTVGPPSHKRIAGP
jgi:hypothetical protein